jgi:hypothetical protein
LEKKKWVKTKRICRANQEPCFYTINGVRVERFGEFLTAYLRR